MNRLKKLSAIFISVLVCIFSAIIFTGCDKNEKKCKLYVFSTQGGYVLVDDNNDPIKFGDEASKVFQYKQGDEIKLKAVPEKGYVFVEWQSTNKLDKSIDLSNEEIEFKINDAELVIKARFVLDSTIIQTVSWEKSEQYTIGVSAENSVEAQDKNYLSKIYFGKKFEFTVSPNEGYDLAGAVVKINGQKLNAVNGVYTIQQVKEDIKITVEGVVVKTYKITYAESNGRYTIEPATKDDVKNVAHGGSFNFKVELSEGCWADELKVYIQYAGETDKNELNATDDVYTINNITKDLTIIVEGVNQNKYTVSYNEEKGYEINPAEGYSFTVAHSGDFIFEFSTSSTQYDINSLKITAKQSGVGGSFIEKDVLYDESTGKYTIKCITDNLIINVDIEKLPQEELKYLFKLSFTDMVSDENSFALTYNQREIEIILTKPAGAEEYTATFTYWSEDGENKETCYAIEFEEFINNILSNDLFLDYKLYGLAGNQNGENMFIIFNGNSTVINMENLPEGEDIYAIVQ